MIKPTSWTPGSLVYWHRHPAEVVKVESDATFGAVFTVKVGRVQFEALLDELEDADDEVVKVVEDGADEENFTEIIKCEHCHRTFDHDSTDPLTGGEFPCPLCGKPITDASETR